MTAWLEAELAADGARARVGQEDALPTDPFGALAAFGVRVLRMESSVEGAYVRDESSAFALVNSRTAHVRQRFTAAHELAHHVLYKRDSPRKFIDVSLGAESADDPEEEEADAFAAAFLMPEADVRRTATQWGTPADAMSASMVVFDVSKDAVARRFTELGLARNEESAAFLKDRRSLGDRIVDLNARHPDREPLVPQHANREMHLHWIDPSLADMVRRIAELDLLETPEALLDLTPDPNG